jgi:hypothetical protein
MQKLSQPDLVTDPTAATYIKDEIVDVIFADCDGQLLSREGPNSYRSGDALITGSTNDRWSVSRDRFDAKYTAIPPTVEGQHGRYRAKPMPVRAKQMKVAFSLARRSGGDVLNGLANDWVLQYAPGDYGVVEEARFLQVYRRVREG